MLPQSSHLKSHFTSELATEISTQNSSISSLFDASLLEDNEFIDSTVKDAHKVYEHLIALWAPSILEASHDLGVFEMLANQGGTSDELAENLHSDKRGMRVLLDALYAYGFVERISTDFTFVYSISPAMQKCLLPGGIYSLVGKFLYDRRLAWNAWRNFEQAVRTGAVQQAGSYSQNQISDVDYEVLVGGINFWAPPAIASVCRALHDLDWETRRAVSVLDVGCGTGLYSQLLLQKFPQWTALGLDCERIAPLAQAQGEQLGVSSRFDCRISDFWQDDWGVDADLILFANIFHLQNQELAQQLVTLAARALAKDGLICIVDHILDDQREADSPQSRFALLFAASMLATGGGDAYTLTDFDHWLSSAGLRRLGVWNTPMHRVLIATHSK